MNRHLALVLGVAVLLVAGVARAEWVELDSSIDDTVAETSDGVYLDGKIYVIGGIEGATFTTSGTTRIYDVATDTWSEGADADFHPIRGAAVTDGTKIYVMSYIDGNTFTPNTNIKIYDPAADAWSNGSSTGGGDATDAVYDPEAGLIYVFGPLGGSGTYIYDPETDAFHADGVFIPGGTPFPCASLQGGEIWTAGALVNFSLPVTGTVPQSYDIAGDAWTALSPIDPAPYWDRGCTSFGATIFLVGGRDTIWDDCVNKVETFDNSKGTWTEFEDLPEDICGPFATVVGNYLFAGGGNDDKTYYNKLANADPEITSTPVTDVTAGDAYAYDVEATDADMYDVLAYSLATNPDGMTIDAATGAIAWDTTGVDAGDYDVSAEVTDGTATVAQDFTISVAGTDDDTSDDTGDDTSDDTSDDDTSDDDDDDNDDGGCGC